MPDAVTLRPVDAANWRGVADLAVAPEDRAFVAEPTRYLALCCYGEAGWRPLAVYLGDEVVGFLMWAIDPDEDAIWLGGVMIAPAWQGRGIGRAAVRAALAQLAQSERTRRFALAYRPENVRARTLYARLGFVETGERDGDEVVARLEAEDAI